MSTLYFTGKFQLATKKFLPKLSTSTQNNSYSSQQPIITNGVRCLGNLVHSLSFIALSQFVVAVQPCE